MPAHGTNASDRYDLNRFLRAQEATFESACEELRRGQKTGHWMWFIFPQMIGLGSTETSRYYGITSLDEATEYLRHPILGERLRMASELVALLKEGSIHQVFPYPDDLKLRSSMTLFAQAASDDQIFMHVIDRHFDGELDGRTLRLIARGAAGL
jgi:uncharacterized protein (DUF1810 family)